MKKILLKFNYLAFIVFFFLGCVNNKDPKIYNVDPEIDEFIDRFVAEAEIRNVTIEKSNLIAQFKEEAYSEKGEFCGQCKQTRKFLNKNGQREIAINPSNICWKAQPDFVKEALIFHELGHCMLARWDHNDKKLPNGAFVSLMNTNDRNIYGPCQYALGDVSECNFTARRAHYIDELFLEKVPIPKWGEVK